MASETVWIDGVQLTREWDELDMEACREGNAKVILNQLRPDERQKHQVTDRQVKQ